MPSPKQRKILRDQLPQVLQKVGVSQHLNQQLPLDAAFVDETGRPVHSEKIVEIDFADGRPVRAGDQFGLGRKR